jgi:drug/metabolite transporter (DMT)-like permease
MNQIKKSPFLPFILLIVGLLCIGWSAIFVKLAAVSGFASAFYRMAFASVAILPLWLSRKKTGLDAKAIKTAIFCGCLFAVDIAFWNTSILLSKAAISTLLANLAPVWVGLASIFIFKEKPKAIFWIGTAVAMFGVIVIVGIDKVYHTKLSVGNMLAIVSSMFYAAYLITTQKVRNALDTVSFTAISMFTSTLVLFVICMVSETKLTGYTHKSWLALIGLALISQLGGWLSINWALGHIKSTSASVTLLGQSVVTALIAVPVLGELLTWPEAFGAVIVLCGIYLVHRRKLARQHVIDPEYD